MRNSKQVSRQVHIPLRGNRSLVASYSLRGRSRTWLVYLSESGAEFSFASRDELSRLAGKKTAADLNFLVINKPGLGIHKTDRTAFEKSFRRKKRIGDALQTLKAIVPKRHRIHLVGYSEGAYLAPQLASLDKRVCSVTMIGGGTRGWLKEELRNASLREKKSYEKVTREIHANPKSLKKWNGFSYATWYSYRGDHTLRALRNISVPTLAILGARDRVIDLKSSIVDLVLTAEYLPIEIHVFGDCGHYFSKHWKQVSLVLGRFLSD